MSALYRLHRDADLRRLNTFGVAARAPWLLQVEDTAALPEALALEQLRGLPLLPVGGGSNLLFAGDAPGVVLVIGSRRIEVLDEPDGQVRVRAEAGVPWHALVMETVQLGLYGLENLALIPGSVGAAPIQNIGAYGMEAGERILAVEAWDREQEVAVRLDRQACAFGYRDSVFKQQPGRWIITAVEFGLARDGELRLGYAGLAEELQAMAVATPGPREVAEAVIRIRQRKLPDPERLGNAGSFFKNPVVPAALAASLRQAHPALPVFAAGDDQAKLSAAWLIDACGWKGVREGDAGVSDAHALVLVNHGNASGMQLLDLARRIAASVQQRFGVPLEPEPRLVGADWIG